MAQLYQQVYSSLLNGVDPNLILREADGAYIPADPLNKDYQAYLLWVAAGNTPDPPAE